MCKTVIELKKETEHERNLSVKSTFRPYRGPGSRTSMLGGLPLPITLVPRNK